MTHLSPLEPANVQQWLIEQLAGELRIDAQRIRTDVPILSYGIDSMQLVGLIVRLEDWLGFRFSSNPLDEHPTIESLSQFVASAAVARQSLRK